MFGDMWELLMSRSDFFADLALEHLAISLSAAAAAIIMGGVIGILISEFRRSSKAVISIVNFLYTIPSISMLGFLIPLSGIGNTTAVIALTIYALLPMVRSTHTGITNVDEAIIEAARGMGSTDAQILWKIKLPLAMPVIMSGIRNMVVMTLALAGIASFIGAGGLGVAIYRGITTNNAAMTVAGSLLIALLALVSDLLLGLAEKRLKGRGAGTEGASGGKARRQRKKGHGKLLAAAAVLVAAVAAVSVLAWQGGGRGETIHIATKPMTEQYIMGEMLDILIEENTDLEVEITMGMAVGFGHPEIRYARGVEKYGRPQVDVRTFL